MSSAQTRSLISPIFSPCSQVRDAGGARRTGNALNFALREIPMTTVLKTGDGDAAAAPEKALRLKFSRYQSFVVALLAFLQFSIILDFMIISPLGAIIMPDLDISPQRFGEI